MTLVNAKADLEKQVNSQTAEIASLAADLRTKSDAAARLQEELSALRDRQAALAKQADDARATATSAEERARAAEERATRAAATATVATNDVALSAEVAHARTRISELEHKVRE